MTGKEIILKYKLRKWISTVSVIVLAISSFSLTVSSIYFLSHRELESNNSNLLAAPIFDQSEINQITTPWGIKLDLFKEMIKGKTPAEIDHYYVDNEHTSWRVNIAYSWENQRGNWIYELKYH